MKTTFDLNFDLFQAFKQHGYTKNRNKEKQRETKALQEQKELGKGSEQGQDSREQRKKWWQFGR